MGYTQIKIKSAYRDKLSSVAQSQNRSMANMIEVLIDQATTELAQQLIEKPKKASKTKKGML